MRTSPGRLLRMLLIAACVAVPCGRFVSAQGRGGGPPSGGGGGMGGGGMGGMNQPSVGSPPFGRNSGSEGPSRRTIQETPSSSSPAHTGLQFGPPGQRWWDDKSFAKSLKLRPDQQTRMDAVFEQNRNALLSRFQGLQQAESQMDEVSRSPAVDEPALFTQIDRVAQARADLEKATAHMLLQLRKELDPDQIARLEKHRP